MRYFQLGKLAIVYLGAGEAGQRSRQTGGQAVVAPLQDLLKLHHAAHRPFTSDYLTNLNIVFITKNNSVETSLLSIQMVVF